MLPGFLLAPAKPRPVFGPGGRLSPFRARYEFYPTPPEATRALLSAESFDGSVWEPACGKGAISKVLEAHGYDVVSTDLVDHGYGRAGIDFLDQNLPKAKHICTNPPYGRGLADAFIRKALAMTAHTSGKVAMLLNIASLCSTDRHASFVRRPPARIYALDHCVCWPEGDPKQATRHTLSHRYVWLVFEPETANPITTEFRWLSTAEFTDAAIARRNAQRKKGN